MYSLKEGFDAYLKASEFDRDASEKSKLLLKHAWMDGASCVLKEFAKKYNENPAAAIELIKDLGKDAHAFDQYKDEMFKQVLMPPAHDEKHADPQMNTTSYRINTSHVGGWGGGWGPGFGGWGWGGGWGYPFYMHTGPGPYSQYPTRNVEGDPHRWDDQRVYGDKALREKYPDIEAKKEDDTTPPVNPSGTTGY
jgi:hypothetical protein